MSQTCVHSIRNLLLPSCAIKHKDEHYKNGKMSTYVDRWCTTKFPQSCPGDLVRVCNSRKSGAKYLSPFKINRRIGLNTFQLENGKRWNASRLVKYSARQDSLESFDQRSHSSDYTSRDSFPTFSYWYRFYCTHSISTSCSTTTIGFILRRRICLTSVCHTVSRLLVTVWRSDDLKELGTVIENSSQSGSNDSSSPTSQPDLGLCTSIQSRQPPVRFKCFKIDLLFWFAWKQTFRILLFKQFKHYWRNCSGCYN